MKDKTEIGLNLTGIQMSPFESEKSKRYAKINGPDVFGSVMVSEEVRLQCIEEADTIGSIPIPGTARGAVNSIINKLSGHPIQILINKIGERIAFERAGVRLYELLLTKAKALKLEQDIIQTLAIFKNEEALHLEIAVASLVSLGGDPTAQTPAALIAGIAGKGLIEVISDPRTNFTQCLDAILIAELTDNAAWELLINITRTQNKDELLSGFQQALEEEANHLNYIKALLNKSMK